MKLSKKGAQKCISIAWDVVHRVPQDQEFEPDDFQGCVVLTVEEAKEAIADYIDVVAEVVRKRNEPEIKIKHPKSIRLLMEKIEQAEDMR